MSGKKETVKIYYEPAEVRHYVDIDEDDVRECCSAADVRQRIQEIVDEDTNRNVACLPDDECEELAIEFWKKITNS